jgi:hypothetical protein
MEDAGKGEREGGIPRHEIHFACRFWRQLPFTKTICVLLNGGDGRRGKSQGEGQNGFRNEGDVSRWMKWDIQRKWRRRKDQIKGGGGRTSYPSRIN